jgi:hypothetical protein
MARIAESTLLVNEWEERPVATGDGSTRMQVATAWMTYRGDLIGESKASIVFTPSGRGAQSDAYGYVASEHVTARLHERSGSFTIQHGGVRLDGRIQCTFGRIVAGSGTRELRGLTGVVSISRRPDGLHIMQIDYDLRREWPWEDACGTGPDAAPGDAAPGDAAPDDAALSEAALRRLRALGPAPSQPTLPL